MPPSGAAGDAPAERPAAGRWPKGVGQTLLPAKLLELLRCYWLGLLAPPASQSRNCRPSPYCNMSGILRKPKQLKKKVVLRAPACRAYRDGCCLARATNVNDAEFMQ